MKAIDKIKIFLHQFQSPLIYILIAASFISFYLKEWIDGSIILFVIFMNSIIGSIQEIRADEALEALKKLSSPHSHIRRGNQIIKILSSEVQVNDILVLEEGDIVSADAKLLSAEGLRIDESSLTGESVPVLKDIHDSIYESTIVLSGHGEAEVYAIKENTEIGKITHFVQKKKEITPLQIKLNDLSKILGIGTILICAIIFFISLLRKGDILEMLITAISLAVAVIPEGLMAIVTITLSIGVQKLVQVNTITRHLPSVETLGSISLVCSDKTGTITKNQMQVEKTFSFQSENELIKAMILCNNATLDSGDPTESALLRYSKKYCNIDKIKKEYPRTSEIPFSSESKMMTTIHSSKNGEIKFKKGAFEVIFSHCQYILEDHKITPLTIRHKKKINATLNEYHQEALRVLAFCFIQDNKEVFIGIIGEKDPIRNGVISSIDHLKEAGIKTIMITGDHLQTARAIGKEIHLIEVDSEVRHGADVERIDEEELPNIGVYARVSPLDKMKIVSRYKQIGYVTAMTGDGVNDAPSLKEADVGIAMGKNGTEVAKSVADIIITDDNFSTIEKAIETGRIIYDNIKKSVIFLLSSNFAEVLIMFLCLILNLPLPLIAVHILWINLISDSLPALALGSDNTRDDVMKEMPRKKEKSLLSSGGWKATIIYGSVICLTTFLAYILYPTALLMKSGSIDLSSFYSSLLLQFQDENILRKSRTFAFTVLGLSELFHMIGMSNVKASIFQILKKKNIFMMIVILVSLCLQIAVTEIPFLVSFFKTEPLSFYEWVWALLLSLFPLVVHEIIR